MEARDERPPARGPSAPGWLVEVPLAHRGLHSAEVAENTLEAFAAARDAGIGVELDVQRSTDGVPVVHHDVDLVRVAGRDGTVAELTVRELAEHGIPTLADALDVLGDTPTMVEVKNHGTRATLLEPQVAQLLARRPDAPWCVASFNPQALGWFREHAPDVPRVLTAGPLVEVPMPTPVRWSLRTLRWLARVDACAISYDVEGVDDPVVQERRDRGWPVVTWTVANEADLARARRWADNVIFEHLPVSTVVAR